MATITLNNTTYTKEQILNTVYPALSLKGANHHTDRFFVPFLDMDISFFFPLDCVGKNAFLTGKALNHLDISPSELTTRAAMNLDQVTTVKMFSDILPVPDMQLKMYVLSTHGGMHGAAAMMNLRALDELANVCGMDLYIFPSSIHEVIAYPSQEYDSYFARMVREINDSILDPEEILTYSVYKYSRDSKELFIADSGQI